MINKERDIDTIGGGKMRYPHFQGKSAFVTEGTPIFRQVLGQWNKFVNIRLTGFICPQE